MESPKLTFAALDARIEALPESPSDAAAFPKKAKWGLFAAAAGAVLGLLSVMQISVRLRLQLYETLLGKAHSQTASQTKAEERFPSFRIE